jgi:hypothetical protein
MIKKTLNNNLYKYRLNLKNWESKDYKKRIDINSMLNNYKYLNINV